MRKFAITLLALVLAIFPTASGKPDTNSSSMELVIEPKSNFTKHWVFVVDGSSSMRGVFGMAKHAFIRATEHSSDEWDFACITFDDSRMERFREWSVATPEEFKAAEEWIETRPNGRRPVLSYGATAIKMALEQQKDELTVVVITDGGFTEVSRAGWNFQVIRDVFEEGQRYRRGHGLSEAIICTIGIENPSYTAGHKPPDEQCQAFLREIGERWNGGYYLVRGAIR